MHEEHDFFFLPSHQGSTPTPLLAISLSILTVFFVYCRCDVTSQFFSLKREGASDQKNLTYTTLVVKIYREIFSKSTQLKKIENPWSR